MVELRLDPVEHGDLPSDWYVSVRVGETQKLSKLSASRLYRFPQAGERRYGKIEVFKRIGQCSIDVDPMNEVLREVNISCQEAGFGNLGLKVAVTAEGNNEEKIASDAAAKKQGSNQKVKAAKEYLAKHSLEVRLSEAMQAVLKERPEDPAEFMAQKLLGHSPIVSGGVKLPPVARSLQAEESKPMPASRLQAEENISPVPPSTKKGPARPQKLEPLQKEVDKAGVQPAGRSSGEDSRCAPQVPAPAMPAASAQSNSFRMKPSVGTWLQGPQVKLKTGLEPPSGPSTAVARLPSVGTWLKPLPKRKQAPAASPALAPAPAPSPSAAFARMPSVGTWLARPSPTKPPQVPYQRKPSVGTWLVHLPAPEVKAASPVPEREPAPAPAGPAFLRKPSVGTWLARPTPARKPALAPAEPSAAAAFARKPSVGTWLGRPLAKRAPAPAPARAAASAAASFARMASVGTWLALPSFVKPEQVPYQRKPSVGTWLARLPLP